MEAVEEGRTRVLVVEDDAEVSKGIVRRLEAEGHVVEATSDPQGVMDRISAGEDPWHVVLLDVGLPDISNIEVSFAQIPSGVRVGLGNFSVHVAVRYTGNSVPVLCESVDGNFTISGISVGGDYDLATGTLQSPRINY